jgi:hypothetical protein
MTVKQNIDDIMANDALDAHESGTSKCEEIEKLIEESGWEGAYDAVLSILQCDDRPEKDWCTAMEVVWAAVLDRHPMDKNKVIAAIYYRFQDAGEYESNLAWSIASNLKGKSYLSSYEPVEDPEIIKELEKLKR